MATAASQLGRYGPERITAAGRRDVVTAFVQRSADGKVLVVQRSKDVRTYPLKFGGVSGGVEGQESLLRRALIEVQEEVGFGGADAQVELVRSGRPLLVDDGSLRFAVHPFLFSLNRQDAAPVLNWENVGASFVAPGDIGRPGAIEDTVPLLRETLARLLLSPGQEVAVQRIAQDRAHGAAQLAKEALHILRDEASAVATSAPTGAAALESLRDFGYHLAACRPAMVPIANSVAAVLAALHHELHDRADAFEVTPSEVCQLLRRSISSELDRLDGAAERLREAVVAQLHDGMTIMTMSLSSTVRDAVLAAAAGGMRLRAVVCESRPLFEGVVLASAWAEGGVLVEVITDAQAAAFVRTADAVLVGADALEAGGVVNKVGTHLLALAAAAAGVPVIAVADTTKLSAGSLEQLAHPGGDGDASQREEKPASEVLAAWPATLPAGVTTRNVYFESTPAALVTRVVTEEGELDPAAIPQRVAALRAVYVDAFRLE